MLREAEKLLCHVDQMLEQTNRIDAVYRAYLRSISQSFKVKRVSLMLLDETRRELFIHESEGLSPSLKTKARIKLGQGIAGWVAERGEALLVGDIEKNPLFRKEKKEKGFRSGAFICIPLKLRGKVYGVLSISEKKSGAKFSERELKDLEMFGMQLAVLIENERLRKEIEWLEKKPVQQIAEVSHDFAIPLTCVQEVLRLMEEGELGPITDSQQEFLELAKRNIKRLLDLFDNLIGMATEVQSGVAETTDVDLAALLEELAANFAVKARRKRVHVELSLPEKRDHRSRVMTNERKMYEVMMNLIDNAVKYAREATDIHLRLKSHQDYVRLEVEDQGPGISEKDKRIIFSKSAVLKQLREQGGAVGHGLGLAISKEMVASLGGKIGFHSKVGKGSLFFVEIPRSGRALEKTAELTHEPNVSKGRTAKSGKKKSKAKLKKSLPTKG
ncbi:MAG: GAF domain-containing sensor histidine kinase [Candidatus Omnitrophota bacterium]|nr:GAF domain-containing sensor histidine kinase [Candidatus Omnitrophota bacterium]